MATKQDSSIPPWQQFTVDSQQLDPVPLEVKGTIPSWVKGSLYKNSSGIYQIGSSELVHAFDGMAILLKFIIENGEVKFQSKILNSETWEASHKANRLVVSQFGTNALPDPCKNIFSRFFSHFEPRTTTDNTSVSIIESGDQLWVLGEANKINCVDPESLSRVDQINYENYVAVHAATAHPHQDKDGSIYNLGTNLKSKMAYNIIKIPAKADGGLDMENSKIVASAPSRWKWKISYNHSFGMSENYFVILEQPFVISLGRVFIKKLAGNTSEKSLVSYPKEKTRFHIVKKDGTRIETKYTMDPFFAFHFCNCYEEEDQMVIDMTIYKDLDYMKKLYLDSLQGNSYFNSKHPPKFARFVVPLDISGAEVNNNLITLDTKATAVLQSDGSVFCTPDLYSEDSGGIMMELPKINYESYNGKKYQYVYGASIFTEKNMIKKLDLKSRTVKEYNDVDAGNEPGESFFIPKPGSTKEDEGVLLTLVMAHQPGRKSYILVLDAETMTELARAPLPENKIMPLTFHGCFTQSKSQTCW
ncbi:beta,beta-carotene 15,15'-dioxygenase [Patella vulgata]|uniref:beta,beta-carotene 15,15'-dioxygenase n=1 Tax=Patella vulgata TaxID=6465 RepID=UPI0021803E50|nr:beta,beta-carotene 15,15'-dioxygenase [Patella vulgata]XP_050412306.1 beta,beta-carotene 15,15'-dioxygenase [Patella vulgata]